jgi:transposase
VSAGDRPALTDRLPGCAAAPARAAAPDRTNPAGTTAGEFQPLFTGRLFYQGMDGKFNAERYVAFLQQVLNVTHRPVFLVQDGARYHTAKHTRQFFQHHAHRLTVAQLPSYSPDYNPIEFLWRALKRRTTHNVYFPEFATLMASVEDALAFFQNQPDYVKSLFTIYLDEMTTATNGTTLAA